MGRESAAWVADPLRVRWQVSESVAGRCRDRCTRPRRTEGSGASIAGRPRPRSRPVRRMPDRSAVPAHRSQGARCRSPSVQRTGPVRQRLGSKGPLTRRGDQQHRRRSRLDRSSHGLRATRRQNLHPTQQDQIDVQCGGGRALGSGTAEPSRDQNDGQLRSTIPVWSAFLRRRIHCVSHNSMSLRGPPKGRSAAAMRERTIVLPQHRSIERTDVRLDSPTTSPSPSPSPTTVTASRRPPPVAACTTSPNAPPRPAAPATSPARRPAAPA